MSFNLDDPLAGILSDGSDDSFFDDDILGKKKPVKKKSTPTPEKKSALFDLDIDKPKQVTTTSEAKKDSLIDLVKPDFKLEDSKTTTSFKPVSPAPFKRTLSKESVKVETKKSLETAKSPAKTKVSASADSLDILGDLNFDTKRDAGKPIEKGKSSQSLLDDILGGNTAKAPSSSQLNRPATAAKSQDFDIDSILGKSESKLTVSSKGVAQKQVTKIDKPKDVVPKKTKTSEDWLGIFQDKEENEDVSDMPSWLSGGDSKKKKAADASTKVAPQKVKETVKIEEKDVLEEEIKPKEPVVELKEKLTPILAPVGLQASNEDLTTEGASMYLQQQESQLMVALQLKAQEEKLAAMQMRQKESQRLQRDAALAHHDQLDAMLQRQMQHRQQMQAIINAHQERISQRIKDLLGTTNIDENIHSSDEVDAATGMQKESPYIKEKKQLLQLVQSLQENHDKEIDLMETSYRRQLAFLEVSLSQSEERMKEGSDKLMKFYSEKINWLEEHHELYKKLTEDNLSSLTMRHKAENEMLRQQHMENVRILQEHHATLMDNIKNAVKQEQSLIQDASGFSLNLQELVSDVKESKTQFQQLVDKVQSLAENTQRDSERNVQASQTHITDMIQQMKTDRENFEKEKNESRDIVKLLESRLKQMNESIEHEIASLKQKKMEFEFEKATFNKQTEFAKNVLKKQDEEIKMVKEDMQREFREKIDRLNEEKMHAHKDSVILAKEKASIQSIKQELEKMKAELQAQMEEVSEDRLRLNMEKQQLHMDEQRIMSKGRDLELLVKAAMDKQSQADKKYSEAELIQSKYEERIRRIQEHAVTLNAREKQIAKEKVSLSRERLALHNEKKQVESRQQCSLCKSTQQVPLYNFETANTFPDSFHNVSVSRDEGDSNVMSAMKAIAQELVSLKLKKQMDLRQRSELGLSESIPANDDRRFEEIGAPTNSLQPQTTSESASGGFKDYTMDSKFMMLRLDIQKMFSGVDQSDKEGDDDAADERE